MVNSEAVTNTELVMPAPGQVIEFVHSGTVTEPPAAMAIGPILTSHPMLPAESIAMIFSRLISLLGLLMVRYQTTVCGAWSAGRVALLASGPPSTETCLLH